MQNFLFTSNSLQSKFNTKISEPLNLTSIDYSKKNKSSLVTKNIARKIYNCFTKQIPLQLKNNLQINFTDCNNLEEAIIKFAKIASKVKAQKKTIMIGGKKYNSLTPDSFINSINASFSDHYETFCTINDINGKYITTSTTN